MIPTSLKNADEHFFIQIKTQGSCTGDKLQRKMLSKHGEHQRAARNSQVGVGLNFCPDTVVSILPPTGRDPPLLLVQLGPLAFHTGTGWPCLSSNAANAAGQQLRSCEQSCAIKLAKHQPTLEAALSDF